MKPWKTIATEKPAHGEPLTLHERNGEYQLRVGGHVLMGSRQHGSEEAMARVSCLGLRQPRPRVMIGGLGFGFTLRAALDLLPAGAEVTLVELSPEVVAMNRGVLAPLAGRPLDDPRVVVEVADVQQVLGRAPQRFDVVLLDVDNGPSALTRPSNSGIYSASGLARAYRALADAGLLVVWSAGPDEAFSRRMRDAGFRVELSSVPAVKGGAGRHVLFVGRR